MHELASVLDFHAAHDHHATDDEPLGDPVAHRRALVVVAAENGCDATGDAPVFWNLQFNPSPHGEYVDYCLPFDRGLPQIHLAAAEHRRERAAPKRLRVV